MSGTINYSGKANYDYIHLHEMLMNSLKSDSTEREKRRILFGGSIVKGKGNLKYEILSITCFGNPQFEHLERYKTQEVIAYIEIYGIELQTSWVKIKILDHPAGQGILEIIKSTGYVELEEESQTKSSPKWKREIYSEFDQVMINVLDAMAKNSTTELLPKVIKSFLKELSPEAVDDLVHADGTFIQSLKKTGRIKSKSLTWQKERLANLEIWGLSKKNLRQFWRDKHLS